MSRRKPFKIAALYVLAVLLLSSCARMRNLKEGEAFLRRQDVVIHTDAPVKLPFDVNALPVAPMLEFNIPSDEILFFSKLKPNRRILWFRFNHSIYLLVNKEKLKTDEARSGIKCNKKCPPKRKESPCRQVSDLANVLGQYGW